MNPSSFTEVEITKLTFPDNIRTRQGMFGSDGETADIDFREIIDNAVDLVLKTRISLDIVAATNVDGFHCVVDNGPGLPLYSDPDYHDDVDPDKHQPITVDLLSQINVGSNFKRTSYSAGMNGVGSKLTNALADKFIVFVNASKKDITTLTSEMQESVKAGNNIYVLQFNKGILEQQLMITYADLKHYMDGDSDKVDSWLDENVPVNFGTCVIFKPDADLHVSTSAKYHGYPFKIIRGLFHHDNDFKNINVTFKLNGKEIPALDFREVFSGDKFIEEKIFTSSVSVATKEPLPVKFIFQVAWNETQFNQESEGSVNTLKTPVGRHISLVQSGITAAFNRYNGIITGADSRIGMRLFVAAFAIEPLFNSQDKSKLSSFQDIGFNEADVVKAISDAFIKIMKADQDYFDLICDRIIAYKKSMNNLSNIDHIKSKVIMGDDSDRRRAQAGEQAKIYEASSRNWAARELYIPEGQSAAGGLIKYRDKTIQSILPLRGKLINTSNFDETELVDNSEILAIINTIGCGIGQVTNVDKSRYGKIIIATDSDPDGDHISNLIVCLFLVHAPELIKSGRIFKLVTPYYAVDGRKGKEYYYADERDKVDFNLHVEKRKGLGSYTPDEVKRFMMNPETRRLDQISYPDLREDLVKESVKLMYSSLARKQLMIDNGILSA